MFGNILRKWDFLFLLGQKMSGIYWSSLGLTSMYDKVSFCEIKIGTREWSMENNENANFE